MSGQKSSRQHAGALFQMEKTYARDHVWKDSSSANIKFVPMTKRDAVNIYHNARHFERATRGRTQSRHVWKGRTAKLSRQDGKVSRAGLQVLHALLFDFLNYKSGRLDPSYQAIAQKACVSVRTVQRAITSLRDAGILNWVRRCSVRIVDGRAQLDQDTNAYGVSPPGQWRGYRPPADPPAPHPSSWGATPAIAGLGLAAGDGASRMQVVLEGGGTPLADALAKLGRRRTP